MIFHATKLPGALVIELERHADERGHFARTWCRDEFARQGLSIQLSQCSVSYNHRRGTLRGMHWQAAPHAEVKLVRCTRGAIFDVIVDLRPNSPTHAQWLGVELTPDNHRMLYIPEGFAHGFQTLADESEVYYQISADFQPHSARGARWNEPRFDIRWPLDVTVISARDQNFPDYQPEAA